MTKKNKTAPIARQYYRATNQQSREDGKTILHEVSYYEVFNDRVQRTALIEHVSQSSIFTFKNVPALPTGAELITPDTYRYEINLGRYNVWTLPNEITKSLLTPETLRPLYENKAEGAMFIYVFAAQGCGACEATKPLFEAFAEQYNQYTDNVSNLRIAAYLGINGLRECGIPEIDEINALPTILLYKNGEFYQKPYTLLQQPAEMLRILADATQDPNEAELLISFSSQS